MSKNILTSLGKPIMAFAATLLILTVMGAGQPAGKLIKSNSITVPVEPPIRIKAIRVAGRNVKASLRFNAPDNWLDELSVEVENISGKRIEHLQLEFIFPSAHPGGPPTLIPSSYGRIPGLEQLSGTPGPPLGRGAAATLGLASKSSILMEVFRHGTARRDAVNIRLARVIFDDGTGWAHGRNTRRDADNPLRWHVLDDETAASSLLPPSTNNVSFIPASWRGAAGKTTRGRQSNCYRWRSYDIIPCNQCGDTISSDNFEPSSCGHDSPNCPYKPVNTGIWCGSTPECLNYQLHLVTWLCSAEEQW